jgi:hypothetical protein
MILNVFVAEPSSEVWMWIKNGIRRHFSHASILRVKDGEQALRFLFQRGLLTDKPPTPDLIVLAADLQIVTAEGVLTRLRGHPRTRAIPVIMRWHERHPSEGDLPAAFAAQDKLLVVRGDELEAQVAKAVHELCSPGRMAAQQASM